MYKIIENLNSYAMTTLFRYICLPVLLFFCFAASIYSNSQLEVGDWDIDDDGRADALTDGLFFLRYTFGLRGDALISGLISSGSEIYNSH